VPVRADPGRGLLHLEAALAAIEVQQAECEAGRGYAFGIFDAGGLVGYVNLNAVVRGVFQNAYLGSRSQSGRTAEATPRRRCARRRGSRSRNFGLHRVQAAVMPRNAGSIGVLEKAGFSREGLAEGYLQINGTWEDHVLFAVTRDEYRSPG
jgi:[ribosomal protein S5]-alanine N-acetyltransferase